MYCQSRSCTSGQYNTLHKNISSAKAVQQLHFKVCNPFARAAAVLPLSRSRCSRGTPLTARTPLSSLFVETRGGSVPLNFHQTACGCQTDSGAVVQQATTSNSTDGVLGLRDTEEQMYMGLVYLLSTGRKLIGYCWSR